MKILVFTDSRGQHKPAGQNHSTFPELLAADPRFETDLYLCPMKWTTTLDFIEMFPGEALSKYDFVFLYTGVVDWSPRPASSAVNDLYDNKNCSNLENSQANTREYARKVVNNKSRVFNSVFGQEAMRKHFSTPFDVEYNGEKTINMYSLEMAKNHLIPRLQKIQNLVFISANRFVHGWEGDYKKGRPANIYITHDYSNLFCESLDSKNVIDLREWNDADVMRHTCDNLHLNKSGSDYIYEKILNIMRIDKTMASENVVADKKREESVQVMSPERILGPKKHSILKDAKCEKHLATLIVGVRLDSEDPSRLDNFMFLLKWLEYYYADLFDILIVEQDSQKKLDFDKLGLPANVRYQFIFNPSEYNRGWGYNVAVRHYCDDSKVVVLMDTDVLTARNFVREVIDCHTKYDAISPYQNIYYSDEQEAALVRRVVKIDSLKEPAKIKNPVTVAGGILIIKKTTFIAIKGFEQYVGYGCEDRAFDVTLFNHLPEARIRIAPFSYVHMHHKKDQGARVRFNEIYDHLVSNYGCKYEPGLTPYDFIHKSCKHASKASTLKLMLARTESFGDPGLYASGDVLTVNGLDKKSLARGLSGKNSEVIFPPDFTSVFSYKQNEIYKSAPDADAEELAGFYNAYQGKRCFIIGNGPSLNKINLSLLESEYTFGVNSFYYKTRETGFKPFFYVVEDSSVMKENIEEIRQYTVPFKFFPTIYKNLHPKEPNVFFFKMNRGFYEKSSPNFVVPRFSTDASEVLYCGQSVTYINLQLAYFMGFTEIYLIGMDFSYVIPESHVRTGDVLLSDTDDPNHFHKDYFGKGKTWKDPKLDRVALNYKMAKLAYEATGRRVYNATVGGNLEIFERVDFASLFAPDGGNKAIPGAGGPGSFADANSRMRAGRYPEALAMYVDLIRADNTLLVYKQAAVDCYLRAAEAGQACAASDVSYIRSLLFGFN